MPLAPWRPPLARALHRNRSRPDCRYFQLATVSPQGRPTNRTVVFRGFLEPTNHLMMVTDYRSEKSIHVQHQPWGAICWYFAKTREQFRLSGHLRLITAGDPEPQLQQARLKLWQALSDGARQQFVWPHPGRPREKAATFDLPPPPLDQPPSQFCLLLLQPVAVEHLELKGAPQTRTAYTLNAADDWRVADLNP